MQNNEAYTSDMLMVLERTLITSVCAAVEGIFKTLNYGTQINNLLIDGRNLVIEATEIEKGNINNLAKSIALKIYDDKEFIKCLSDSQSTLGGNGSRKRGTRKNR